MFKLKTEQKRFNIGKVSVGGDPGKYPTVLIGTIFYHGQKLIIDETSGEFDRKKAEELINRQEEFSDKTGNPCMLDIVGASTEALVKALDFAAATTDLPLLLDGISMNVRIGGLKYVKESGLINRVVYNSITPTHKKEELEAIIESGIKSAVLLALNIKDFTSRGRVQTIQELLLAVYNKVIKKPLLDLCVMEIPTLGVVCKAILDVKNQTGLPTGSGAHNAISTWRGLRTKMGKQAIKPCTATASAITVAMGADFVLYGPIEEADHVFPAIAMVDAAYGQIVLEQSQRLSPDHPRYRIT